ncbi:MAG TPA: hypothetical protein VL171_06290 [Verrucomicrobiae bacterium]|nr:hypothetical protein [Verrucomicrobiae bacterium]
MNNLLARILEKITGKDDLERVAYKEDLNLFSQKSWKIGVRKRT